MNDKTNENNPMFTRRETINDNRDGGTTWLWISDTDYIEVTVRELIENVAENNPTDLRAVLHAELDTLIDKLEQEDPPDGILDLAIRGTWCPEDEVDVSHFRVVNVVLVQTVDDEWIVEEYATKTDEENRFVSFQPGVKS